MPVKAPATMMTRRSRPASAPSLARFTSGEPRHPYAIGDEAKSATPAKPITAVTMTAVAAGATPSSAATKSGPAIQIIS